MTSPDVVSGYKFTDRDRGKGFVLSAFRTSGATKGEHVISHSVDAAGNRCMKCQLLGMGQNVVHVYKTIVN
jgi:hypothetical protein